MKTTLLVMTLNEIDGMRQIMPAVNREWCDQIIVVDGGSTDGTVEWAREQGYEVYCQKQKGIRHGYFEVLPLVKGELIILFSPDGNCLAEIIPELKQKIIDGYDMVIGSRYLGHAISEDDDLFTGFGNWLFTRTVNLLYGGGYTDVMVIFRAFRRRLIDDLDLLDDGAYSPWERIFRTVISWEPLMSVRAMKAGKRVTEVPASEPRRLGGVRKLQVIRWGAAYYLQFLRELFYWRPSRQSLSRHAREHGQR